MPLRKSLCAAALVLLPGAALADDYFGTLKPPQSSLSRPGLYSFTTGSTVDAPASFAADGGYRLKLGYKYSRYFAVEGEYVDFGRSAAEMFTSPGNLAPSFRSTGFGVDTIAMLPLWRFSFYGRMGAYRGDSRGGFGFVSTSLLPADVLSRATRMRYGMGVRYDFTKAFGIRAELERTSAVGSPFAADLDTADQVSVGLSWRF
jgi:OmpA-OmpF porin, OOP family